MALLLPESGALLFEAGAGAAPAPPARLDTGGARAVAAAWHPRGGSLFAAAGADGTIHVVGGCDDSWGVSGSRVEAPASTPRPPFPSAAKRIRPGASWPSHPPLALAFGPGDALIALYGDGRVLASAPPYVHAAPLPLPADRAATLAQPPGDDTVLFLAGPGAASGGGVRASVWRLAAGPGGSLTANRAATSGAPAPRSWLSFGEATPVNWTASISPGGGLAAVAPGGGPLALFAVGAASLSRLALTPPPSGPPPSTDANASVA